MKKAIIIAILLSSTQMQCMDTKDKVVAYGYLGSLVAYGIYHFLIKDPNVRLLEQRERERQQSELNLLMGSERKIDQENQQLRKFFSDNPGLAKKFPELYSESKN